MDDLGITVTAKAAPLTTADKYTYSETLPLAGFLNASPSVDHDKLSEIADYIRGDKKEFTDIDLLNEIRHIEVRLGAPKIGEKRIDKVYQYVKLQRTAKDVESQLQDLLL